MKKIRLVLRVLGRLIQRWCVVVPVLRRLLTGTRYNPQAAREEKAEKADKQQESSRRKIKTETDMPQRDYYAILGVSKDATPEDFKKGKLVLHGASTASIITFTPPFPFHLFPSYSLQKTGHQASSSEWC